MGKVGERPSAVNHGHSRESPVACESSSEEQRWQRGAALLWYRSDILEIPRSQQDLDADLNAEVAEVGGGDSVTWHESEHHQR